MAKIYEYFGILFYIYSNDHLPIHLHAKFAEYECKVILVFKDGLLAELKFMNVKGKPPLPLIKQKQVAIFIQSYSTSIVEKWNQINVLKLKLPLQKITQKIKG